MVDTLIATEGKAPAGNVFAGVTVVTLVTMDCGCYLDRGERLYFVGPYCFNLTRRTRRAEQGVPYLCDL